MWFPKKPLTLEEAKLDANYVEESILKILQVNGPTDSNHVFAVTLRPDRADFRAVDPNGDVFDQFSIAAKP